MISLKCRRRQFNNTHTPKQTNTNTQNFAMFE